jgi:hypothetical protein
MYTAPGLLSNALPPRFCRWPLAKQAAKREAEWRQHTIPRPPAFSPHRNFGLVRLSYNAMPGLVGT